MKAASIATHLRPYSILQKRTTTINHAFASAIAPAEALVGTRLNEALRVLDQSPEADLLCVYCNRPAETWDHLVALVRDGEMSGHGHTFSNLVPACRDCNSKKGNKEWRSWLRASRGDYEVRISRIEHYVEFCGSTIRGMEDLERVAPQQMKRYAAVRHQVLDLLREADKLADEIRSAAAGREQNLTTGSSPEGRESGQATKR